MPWLYWQKSHSQSIDRRCWTETTFLALSFKGAKLKDYFLQVQALVGFEKTIKHLDEHLVDIGSKVRISSLHFLNYVKKDYQPHIWWTILIHQGITKPKEVRKFKGEGMPLHMSNKKGDLYVTFEVLFPRTLTEEQKTQIKSILG